MKSERKTILVNRADGLGQRLKYLVSGMYLADLLGFDFKLHWPDSTYSEQFHSIVSSEDFFEPEFVQRSIVSAKEAAILSKLPRLDRLESDSRTVLNANNLKGIFCNKLLSEAGIEPDVSKMSEIYWNLPLHDNFRWILDNARAFAIEDNATALHLRGGDIIYGTYRHFSRFQNKVLPISVAKLLARESHDAGKQLLVFAQDAEIIRELRKTSNCLMASDLAADLDLDSNQLALFEMSLLMRCKTVISGNSGFAEISALVTGAEMKDYRTLLPASEIAATLAADLADSSTSYNDLHRAFLLYLQGSYLNPRQASDALPNPIIESFSEAWRLDSSNGLYPFMLAVQHSACGELDDVEQVLSEAFKVEIATHDFAVLCENVPILRTACALRPDKHPIMSKYFTAFDFDHTGRPFSQLLYGILCRLTNKDDKAVAAVAELNFDTQSWHPFHQYVECCTNYIRGQMT